MSIYVICNEKGGAGKSCIAQSLAAYLKLEKKQDILLVDADPQRTTAEWAAERIENGLAALPCIELTGNIAQNLIDLSNRYSEIVVDCGGADSQAMRSALAVANTAILPFRPKRRDLKVAPAMSDIIETAQALNSKLQIFSVITQTPTLPSQGYRTQNAKRLLESLDLNPVTNCTRNLNSWDDAEESGTSVFEYNECDKAASDARAVFEEILGGIK